MEFSSHLEWCSADSIADLRSAAAQAARLGCRVIDLSMINPDLSPPRVLIDRLIEASMKERNHRYAVSRGVRRLREAFSEKYASAFGVRTDPENEVCVTLGTKDGILMLLRAICPPASRVLTAAPLYPAHYFAARMAGLEIDTLPFIADEEQCAARFAEELRRKRYPVLLINLPANPSGAYVSESFYQKLLPAARDCGTLLVNDFAYGEMGFAGQPNPVSALCLPEYRDNVVESYTLSKAYSVPGWRVGALLGAPAALQRVATLKAHLDYGLFLPLQIAAAAALSSKDRLHLPFVESYERRSRVLVQGLTRLGWKVEQPRSGASVWAELPEASSFSSAREFVRELANRQGVIALPGELFGGDYSRHVRFALVADIELLREVLERIERLTSAAARVPGAVVHG